MSDVVAALERGREKAAFPAPLDRFTHAVGLRLDGWNPFVETTRAILGGRCASYDTSPLRGYYEGWQPRNAAEALIGFGDAPGVFSGWPPYMGLCVPWSRTPPAGIEAEQRRWIAGDGAQHGVRGLTLEDGHKFFGPLSRSAAELQYRRLHGLVERISASGYQRSHGDVRCIVLRRGSDLLFVLNGGMHRTVVMKGIGHDTIATWPCHMVDLDDAGDWPQVRSGLWSRDSAERYFHHLFDFDYGRWAQGMGLHGTGRERVDGGSPPPRS